MYEMMLTLSLATGGAAPDCHLGERMAARQNCHGAQIAYVPVTRMVPVRTSCHGTAQRTGCTGSIPRTGCTGGTVTTTTITTRTVPAPIAPPIVAPAPVDPPAASPPTVWVSPPASLPLPMTALYAPVGRREPVRRTLGWVAEWRPVAAVKGAVCGVLGCPNDR